ncbi:hypothetical protein L1049_012097 [Liquidambar formosana]|uniref:Farnesyl pyrophosphate synthase n=1 Tax=Liquidambar formosana TaxID=63359 RepID=A0AAP0RT14_LIQFO
MLEMLDYNVPGGKLNRELSVIESYQILKEGKELTEDEIFLASALRWCIEWLQAYFLVLDDIMDNSHTRRGQPCWFKLPKVEFQTASGQMIDLITTLEGEKDLSKYSLPLCRRIVQYKTAYYSFYPPVACALVMSGENLDNHIDVKNILVEVVTYFQVQDDYLDCLGEPEKIGKIGTDIEDFKCSWFVVKALERCNEEQKKVLHYYHPVKDNHNNILSVNGFNYFNFLQHFLSFYGFFKSSDSCVYKKSGPRKGIQFEINGFEEICYGLLEFRDLCPGFCGVCVDCDGTNFACIH